MLFSNCHPPPINKIHVSIYVVSRNLRLKIVGLLLIIVIVKVYVAFSSMMQVHKIGPPCMSYHLTHAWWTYFVHLHHTAKSNIHFHNNYDEK